MKYLFIVSLLISNMAQAAPSGEFLTQDDKQRGLRAIDIICGDTWCEGDFGYKFQEINCDSSSKTCTVKMEISLHPEEEFNITDEGKNFTGSISTSHRVACTVKNVSSIADVLRPTPNLDLVDSFYTPLSDCIMALGNRLFPYPNP